MLFKLVTIIFDVILNILANIVHFNTPSPKDCQLDRCVPLVVHGDGADSHRRRSFLVFLSAHHGVTGCLRKLLGLQIFTVLPGRVPCYP